jgi:hypothetical protein
MANKEKEFQDYLAKIQADLQKRSADQIDKMNKEIEDFYRQNGWESQKFVAGQNVDFMHTASWSLDRLTEVINTIASAIFGGTPAPDGITIAKPEEISAAIAGMEKLEQYFASRVLVALTGVLDAFGKSTSVTFKTQYKSEALGNGFHLFTTMACDSYDDNKFFNKEKILEYLYAYEVRFSAGEAKSHAKIPLINALSDAIAALGKKITAATTKWTDGSFTDEQYLSSINTYSTVQTVLMGQLSDLTEENKKALRLMVAVPPIILD